MSTFFGGKSFFPSGIAIPGWWSENDLGSESGGRSLNPRGIDSNQFPWPIIPERFRKKNTSGWKILRGKGKKDNRSISLERHWKSVFEVVDAPTAYTQSHNIFDNRSRYWLQYSWLKKLPLRRLGVQNVFLWFSLPGIFREEAEKSKPPLFSPGGKILPHFFSLFFGLGFSFLPEETSAHPHPHPPFLAIFITSFLFFSICARSHPQMQRLANPGGSRYSCKVFSAILTTFSWSFFFPSWSLFLRVPSFKPRKWAASAVGIPFK